MVWIANQLDSEFLRHVAYVLFAVVMGRFCFIDLPDQFLEALHTDRQLGMERLPTGIGATRAVIRHPDRFACRRLSNAGRRQGEGIVDRATAIPPWIGGNWAMRLLMIGAVITLFMYLDVELNRTVALLRTGPIARAHARMAGGAVRLSAV